MKNYNHKKRNFTSGSHLLGIIFIGAGVLSIASPLFISSPDYSAERSLWTGIAAIAIGLVIVSTFTGSIISFGENKIKEYTSILGYKMGSWSTLPEIKQINLTSELQESSNTPNGISPTLSGTTVSFKVLLVSSEQDGISFLEFSKKDKAISCAKLLSKGFDKPLESDFSL